MYQEILINIWKSLEKFRGDSAISTWLYRVAIAFSIYALYFRYLKNSYDKIDYSVPALDMLKKVAKNESFFKARTIVLFIPGLILAINVSISISSRFNIGLFQSDILSLLFVIACFILLLAIFGFIGYIKRNKKHKPYRNRALALIEDIEKDTSS